MPKLPRAKEVTLPYTDVRERLMRDPEMQQAARDMEPEYHLIRQIIIARSEQHLSQADLAAKIGTKQSNISRLENGNMNHSVQFLQKVAAGLGKELHIELR